MIGLKAVNCNTGDVLAEAQEQAAGKEAVLKALDAAAISLRSKLGESLSSVQKYATPLEEATTPSLEALKAYSLGRKTSSAKGDTAALPFYKRAVELDPNFAMAYAAISTVYSNLNEAGRAAENARKAYELREKVSERERFSIEAIYYMTATGELEKAAQVYELWQQTYPRDDSPYANLGFISASLGNWEKALEEAREAMRLEPNDEVNYVNLGARLHRTSTGWMRRRRCTSRRRSASWRARACCSTATSLAFLKGDAAQMAQLVCGRHGQAGHGRLAAGLASRHGSLVREVEERTRADPAGDGFSPAQRRQRDCRNLSGGGGAARGGIGQPGAGSRRCRCGTEAGPEPRCTGDGGAGPGAGRRYGSGRRSWRPNSTRHSRWTRWSRGIGCPRSGRPSPCSAKTRTAQSNY